MKQRFLNQKLGKRVSRKQELRRTKICAQRAAQPKLPRAPKG
jgi:hypothetical protein